jgi:two-component system nitrogen regulation response regulator GlnG
VDVRLVAATDADLEARANDGRFRLPLIMRLSGYELALPRLAERPDDIARLFVHFVREELAAAGRLDRLSPTDDHGQAWLPSWLIEGLLAHAWPGNVRELKNFVRQLVIDQVDAPRIQRSALEWLGRHSARKVAGDARGEPPSAAAEADAPEPVVRASRRTLEDIPEEEVAEVMRKHRFEPGPAAQELGISRTSLYVLLERHPHLKKAKDLSADDIRRALDAHGRRLPAAAEQLGVSVRALRLRMSDLGLD